jgi:hypothetical protein
MAEILIIGEEKPRTVVQAVAKWLEENYNEPYAWEELLRALEISESEHNKAVDDSYYGKK